MRRRFGGALHAGLHQQRGVGLVEVLVSVLILGIGMLGVAAMQATALRYGQSSLETSQAVMQTYSIIESMRANPANAAAYNTGGLVCEVPVPSANLASNDVSAWIASMKNTIGLEDDETTCGQISGCPDNCVITVQWDDSRARDGSDARQIVTETRI